MARGFYALENTLFPALVSTLCMLAGLPVIYGCMKILGVNGVALGLSVTVMVSAFALFESWSRKTQNPGKKQVYLFLTRLILASLVLGGVLTGIHRVLSQPDAARHPGPGHRDLHCHRPGIHGTVAGGRKNCSIFLKS